VSNVYIFDCLEFDERYRFGDTGLDIAFLAMDLEAHGRADLADLFIGLYCSASGDSTLPLVLRFYKCYRAFVRGKVRTYAANQLEPGSERDAAQSEARELFALAAGYVRDPSPPWVLVVCGLTGSGKSVLAGTLAARLGAAVLSTDVTRKQLLGVQPTESLASDFGTNAYSEAATEEVYGAILAEASRLVDAGHSVVLDGTFSLRKQRQPVSKLATSKDIPMVFIECRASEEVIRRRQAARSRQGWATSDATWETYLGQKERAEPFDEITPNEHIIVDTTQDLSALLRVIEEAVTRQ
jgi:uncharacterized protein